MTNIGAGAEVVQHPGVLRETRGPKRAENLVLHLDPSLDLGRGRGLDHNLEINVTKRRIGSQEGAVIHALHHLRLGAKGRKGTSPGLEVLPLGGQDHAAMRDQTRNHVYVFDIGLFLKFLMGKSAKSKGR